MSTGNALPDALERYLGQIFGGHGDVWSSVQLVLFHLISNVLPVLSVSVHQELPVLYDAYGNDKGDIMNKTGVTISSFSSLRYWVYFLITLVLAKTVANTMVELKKYTNFINGALFLVLAIMIGTILYGIKKGETLPSRSKEIRGSPLILLLTGIFVIVMGNILSVLGLYIGLLFIFVGLLILFESVTTKILVNDEGITVQYHKLFPFPGLFFPFETLSDIKIKGPIINLKQQKRMLVAQRYLLFDVNGFIKQIKNTPYEL